MLLKNFPPASVLGGSALWGRKIYLDIIRQYTALMRFRKRLFVTRKDVERSQTQFGNKLLERQRELINALPVYTDYFELSPAFTPSFVLPDNGEGSIVIMDYDIELPKPCNEVFILLGNTQFFTRFTGATGNMYWDAPINITFNGENPYLGSSQNYAIIRGDASNNTWYASTAASVGYRLVADGEPLTRINIKMHLSDTPSPPNNPVAVRTDFGGLTSSLYVMESYAGS